MGYPIRISGTKRIGESFVRWGKIGLLSLLKRNFTITTLNGESIGSKQFFKALGKVHTYGIIDHRNRHGYASPVVMLHLYTLTGKVTSLALTAIDGVPSGLVFSMGTDGKCSGFQDNLIGNTSCRIIKELFPFCIENGNSQVFIDCPRGHRRFVGTSYVELQDAFATLCQMF